MWFGGVQRTFFCLSVNEARKRSKIIFSAVFWIPSTSHATTALELYNYNLFVLDNHYQLPTPTRVSQDDYSSALLFLRQGTLLQTCPRSLSIGPLHYPCLLAYTNWTAGHRRSMGTIPKAHRRRNAGWVGQKFSRWRRQAVLTLVTVMRWTNWDANDIAAGE